MSRTRGVCNKDKVRGVCKKGKVPVFPRPMDDWPDVFANKTREEGWWSLVCWYMPVGTVNCGPHLVVDISEKNPPDHHRND